MPLFFNMEMSKIYFCLYCGEDFIMWKKGNKLYFPFLETNLEMKEENQEVLSQEINEFLGKHFGAREEEECCYIEDGVGIYVRDIEEILRLEEDDTFTFEDFLKAVKDEIVVVDSNRGLSKDKTDTFMIHSLDNRILSNGGLEIALNEDNYEAFKLSCKGFEGNQEPYNFQLLTPIFEKAYKEKRKQEAL